MLIISDLVGRRNCGVDTHDLGAPCHSTFRNAAGHVRADARIPDDVVERYGGGFIGMLRPDQYRRMLAALPEGMLHVHTEVAEIADRGDHVELTLKDGSTVRTPLLVGADGIDSTVRTHVWGASPKREHRLQIIGGYCPMSDVAPSASSIREPQQARSRASWLRVVAAGRDLLAEGGYDALTISEVCRRAGVTAPSIYARVDGRAGLLRAVYEDVMQDVVASEDELFGSAEPSVAGAVGAAATVFDRHSALMGAIIRQAVEDPWLLSHGAMTSRRLRSRIAGALHARSAEAAASAARVVYEACVFRTIYGPTFWSDEPETLDEFCARLTRVAEGVLGDG